MIITIIIYILNNLISIFDVESLIRYGGLLLAFVMVFGQTGLFFCFFLPSGAVMFTSGVFAATGDLPQSIFSICIMLTGASLLGNMTGYWIGRKTGPLLYERKDSRFFRQKYLKAAEAFYKKNGGLALAAGLFLPFIRTFSPVVAGIIKVNFRRFVFFTFIGSLFWVFSFVMAGYLVGRMPFLKPYLRYIIIAIILIVTTPVLIRIIRQLKKATKAN